MIYSTKKAEVLLTEMAIRKFSILSIGQVISYYPLYGITFEINQKPKDRQSERVLLFIKLSLY